MVSCIFISTLLEDYLRFPSVLLSINYPPISAFAKMGEANKIDDFRREWLRQHRARSDWQAIIKPCYDNMAWGKVKRGWEKANRTNSLLLLSNDEVKDAHSDFNRCLRGGGLRPKFLSMSIFLGHTLRSKITTSWNMSQYQNSLRISLETSVFYPHFQVPFFLVVLLTSRLDTAAEETWLRFQFSLYREWYGRSMYNAYLIP